MASATLCWIVAPLSKMNFAVRHAQPRDYLPIARALDDWWGGRRAATMLPRLFFVHFSETTFVAEAEGGAVAFLAGFRSQTCPEQAYVHLVGVEPAWHGRGLARALYQRFFAATLALGCREVHCVISPTDRLSTAFHVVMGFRVLPGDERTSRGVKWEGEAGREDQEVHADWSGPPLAPLQGTLVRTQRPETPIGGIYGGVGNAGLRW